MSKGWKLIQRFSEDIDVVIDRDYLGFGRDRSPEAASSHKQRAKRIDELKDQCQSHIRAVLLPAFRDRVREVLPGTNLSRIENDPDDEDDQTILSARTHRTILMRRFLRLPTGREAGIVGASCTHEPFTVHCTK